MHCLTHATRSLQVRNEEVRRSMDDLISLVKTYPRENQEVVLEESELDLFTRHYSRQMYQAVLECTQKSLAAMKKRLGSKVWDVWHAPRRMFTHSLLDPLICRHTHIDRFRFQHTRRLAACRHFAFQRAHIVTSQRTLQVSGGIFYLERPFFDVDVELKVPNVSMNPSLDEIQEAINSCAKKILATSQSLPCWGMPDVDTFYEFIACDKEIVKSILRLTGSVEGIKHQVQHVATCDYMGRIWAALKASSTT